MNRRRPWNPRSGFSLMETVLALFVLTIGIMGVFALFPAGLTASRDAMHDSRISLLAEAVMADLRRELAENFDPNAGRYKFEDDENFTGTVDANPADDRPQLIEDLNTGTPIGRFKLTVRPNTEFASGKLAEAMLECWPGPGELSGPTLERQRRLVFYTRILDRSE